MAQDKGTAAVLAFLTALEHPLKEEIKQLRLFILDTDTDITEHIKWKAPSFVHQGDDRITFNLQGKGFVRLIFHRGAKVKDSKGKGRLIEDPFQMMEWQSDDRALIQFTSMEEVLQRQEQLQQLVKAWLQAASDH